MASKQGKRLTEKEALSIARPLIWSSMPIAFGGKYCQCIAITDFDQSNHIGIYLAYNYLDWNLPPLSSPLDRIIYALQWHCLSVAVLFNMMMVWVLAILCLFSGCIILNNWQNVINERRRGAWNPLHDPENQGNIKLVHQIFSNTLEQIVMFVLSTLILSTYLEPGQMKIIPIFVVTWVLSRFVFQYWYVDIYLQMNTKWHLNEFCLVTCSTPFTEVLGCFIQWQWHCWAWLQSPTSNTSKDPLQ